MENPNFSTESGPTSADASTPNSVPRRPSWSLLSLTLHSLGIIFGDIGTSPLYVLETIFHHQKTPPTEFQCIGAVSLIIWSLILVVSIKYAIFILKADNKGEGGTFALCALLTKKSVRLNRRTKDLVNIVSILAASLLIGDGALTPAVSVLSAVEGLALNAPNLHRWVVPITIVILILLFVCQRWGTAKIGNTFAPIMFIWFFSLFAIGIWRIRSKPLILKAFNPYQAVIYLIREKKDGFSHIGGVFLSVTGCEALFADLGHFGLWPIRISWFAVVFPSVVINYLGQGAHLIVHPQSVENPFYRSVPPWAHWPMLILATSATIIASQAIITGCFSLLSQAASLGFCGPLRVYHTNEHVAGQIYVPTINWILLLLTLLVTVYFQSSSRLTNAYGLTVCSVSVITTVLFLLLLHYVWKKPLIFTLVFSLFLLIDCLFWSSNALKFLDGAWIAICIALIFFFVGFSWYWGERKLKEKINTQCPTNLLNDLPMRFGLADQRKSSFYFHRNVHLEMNSSEESDDEDPTSPSGPVSGRYLIERNPISILSSEFDYFQATSTEYPRLSVVPGLGCFLTENSRQSPMLFEIYLRLLRNIPQLIIFLQIEYLSIPFVQREKRLIVKSYGENLFHLKCRIGFGETTRTSIYADILLLAKELHQLAIPDDEQQITYFVPNDFIRRQCPARRSLPSLLLVPVLAFYSFQKSLLPRKTINIHINPTQTLHFGILHHI